MNDQERLEKRKVEGTEKLTKAVLALNTRFKKNEDIAKKSGLIGDKSIFKTIMGEQKEKIKNLFSLKGAAGMLGIGPDSILGKVIDMRHDKKQEQKAEKEKAFQYAKNFQKFDPRGQELAKKSEKAALEEGVKLYQEQKKILEEIQTIEKNISEARDMGQGDIVEAANADRMRELKDRKHEIQSPYKTDPSVSKKAGENNVKPGTKIEPTAITTDRTNPVSDRLELIDMIREALIEKGGVIEKAKGELKEKTGADLTKSEEGVLAKGIRSGMTDELLKLNEEQLEMLKKLVENTEISKEDQLESKIKKSDTPATVGKVEKAEKAGNGLLSSLMNGLNLISNFMKNSPLGKIVTGAMGAARMIGSGARMLGSVASGAWSAGKAIAKGAWGVTKAIGSGAAKLGGMALSTLPILNSGAKIAGKEGAEVAGKVVAKEGAEVAGKVVAKEGAEVAGKVVAKEGAEVAGKVVAKEGAEVAGKVVAKEGAKELGKTGAKTLGKSILKKIPGIGLLAGIGFGVSRMMDGDYLGAAGEVASGLASTIPGIGTAASLGIDAALAGRDVMNEVSKTETTSREEAGLDLERNNNTAEEIAKQKAGTASAAPAPTIINNNVVNNTAKTVKLSTPPVRNIEPSYNNRLYSSIATVGVRG